MNDEMAVAANGTGLTTPWITSTFQSPTPTNPLGSIMQNIPIWALLLGGFFGLQIIAIAANILRQLVCDRVI
jgi:hypothetical protein